MQGCIEDLPGYGCSTGACLVSCYERWNTEMTGGNWSIQREVARMPTGWNADHLSERTADRAKCRRATAAFLGGMKIDPYYQRQKYRPMILVSGNIRFMGMFVGVPLGGGIK